MSKDNGISFMIGHKEDNIYNILDAHLSDLSPHYLKSMVHIGIHGNQWLSWKLEKQRQSYLWLKDLDRIWS